MRNVKFLYLIIIYLGIMIMFQSVFHAAEKSNLKSSNGIKFPVGVSKILNAIKVSREQMDKIKKNHAEIFSGKPLEQLNALWDQREGLDKKSDKYKEIQKKIRPIMQPLFQKFREQIKKILGEEKFKEYRNKEAEFKSK